MEHTASLEATGLSAANGPRGTALTIPGVPTIITGVARSARAG